MTSLPTIMPVTPKCAACNVPFRTGDEHVTLPCKERHCFHSGCVRLIVRHGRPCCPKDEEPIEGVIRHAIAPAIKTEAPTCTICLEQFKTGDHITTFPCFHFFHTVCINPLLRRSDCVCPIDRVPVPRADKKNLPRSVYHAPGDPPIDPTKLTPAPAIPVSEASDDGSIVSLSDDDPDFEDISMASQDDDAMVETLDGEDIEIIDVGDAFDDLQVEFEEMEIEDDDEDDMDFVFEEEELMQEEVEVIDLTE